MPELYELGDYILCHFLHSQLDMSAPSSERQAQATEYPGFAYFRVDNGVDGIMSALADEHMVSIGTPWFERWRQTAPGTPGLLAPVSLADPIAGGHETLLYGYEQGNIPYGDIFYGQNSWSDSWGNQGRFLMLADVFELFKQVGGYDAHYITFDKPQPAPEPPGCLIGLLRNLVIWR